MTFDNEYIDTSQNNSKQAKCMIVMASGYSIGNKNPCVYKVIMTTMELLLIIGSLLAFW